MASVRTMRRSVRRELDENHGDGQVSRGVVEAMTPLLQKICDERLWQQRENECVLAITQVRSKQNCVAKVFLHLETRTW